jgi:MFS superfamily sulfate permease-like transporter
VHALTLLAIVLLLAPLARFIPLATLAAVLFVVAYNMGEWREIGSILRLDLAEKSVWLITLALTVIADLTIAVEVGMGLAALLYIKRISQTTTVSTVSKQYIEDGRPHILQDKELPSYVTILRIHGPFLFGTTDQLADETVNLSKFTPIIILRLRNMTAMCRPPLRARWRSLRISPVLAPRLRAICERRRCDEYEQEGHALPASGCHRQAVRQGIDVAEKDGQMFLSEDDTYRVLCLLQKLGLDQRANQLGSVTYKNRGR